MSKTLRILVIEDSEDDTELLVRELRRGGYDPMYERVESAENMRVALTQRPWDLVVADYTMPHFNALAALALLKESGFDLPFIIVSATIGEERAVAAMKAGAHDYLMKDRLARLVPVIERELREAQMRQERRQAEAVLHDREQRFRALIENASDVILTLDPTGRITYVSPALFRVLGYSPVEYVGLNAFDMLHPDDVRENTAVFAQLLKQPGGSIASQFRFRHKDGSWRWLEAVASNLLAEPSVQAVVTNLRDVTERNHLEAQFLQAQKMEAIGHLTAGIAHDFNNLLTAINGFAGLMKMRLPPDNPLQETTDMILHSGQQAANLVRQLLTFSRKQIVTPEIIELNAVVTKVERMLERIIGEHIHMITNLAPDLWPIKADPMQMEQIIVNLAINARDAMLSGGRLIIETNNAILDEDYVATHLEALPGAYVLLAIGDTGIGMTEEVKAHLFEPFFTTKGQGKGTGLGLATVYGIVKHYGGCIWVGSEIGQGSTFKIYLPRAEVSHFSPSPSQRVVEKPTGSETILLVEDSGGVRDMVRRTLEELGYTVLAAPDGPTALELVDGYPGLIDLLLTDVVMPGLSGKDLAERLLQTRIDLKVIFMSGYSEEAIANRGILSPHTFLLQKPFSPLEMALRVREVLDEGQDAKTA